MNEELEEAIKSLKEDRDSYIEASQCGLGYPSDNREHKEKAQAIETVLNYIENSIPKEKVEEKIEEINKNIDKYREYTELGIETDIEWVDNVADRQIVKILQELLEGK